MRRIEIPVGTRYGRLVTTSAVYPILGEAGCYVDVRCDCGIVLATKSRRLREGTARSCGCLSKELSRSRRYGHPKNYVGRQINWAGYVLVHDPLHPNSDKKGYVREHVKLMATQIGRPLEQHENVHHINGQRQDNRTENLELWSSSQPPGQRVDDKVQWAKELLRLYEPEALAEEVLL